MSLISCGDVVLGYLNNSEHQSNEKILVKMKGYMLLLTQNLHAIIRNINELIDEFLATFIKDEQERYQKGRHNKKYE